MRRLILILLAPATLLASCQEEASAPARPQKEIHVRSEGQKRLFAANDLSRAIGLKRAIMESGSSCGRVATTGFVGTYKNMDYWTASCVDNFDRARDWAIFIGADDSAQVRLCSDTQAVGLPACIARPGSAGGSGMATEKRPG
ncbi:MAG: hypothetical protein M3Q88_02150 [Pseudomonadota bacterium]|nr:hypothetical protein [Pseudomonadota bacterium]